LGNTLPYWLPIDNPFGDSLLPSTSPYSNSIDNISLLPLVPQSPSLGRSTWPLALMNGRQLPEFPCSHPKDKLHDIALLFLPKFFEIFECTHSVI